MSIQKAIESYLNYCVLRGLTKATITGYRSVLKNFICFLLENGFDINVDDIKKVDKFVLKSFFLTLQQKYAQSSVIVKHCQLSAFYSWLVDELEYLDVNIVNNIKLKFNRESRKQTVARVEDVKKIFDVFNAIPYQARNFKYYRDKLIFQILFSCGVRVNELVHLKYSDYKEDEHSFKIIGKGNKERYVYLPDDVLNTFERFTNLRPYNNDYLFIFGSSVPCATCSIRDLITRWCKLAGITTNLTPHSFRRGFATTLIEHDIDVAKVQAALGHSDIQTTMRYVQLSDKSVKETMKNYNPLNYIKGDNLETKTNKS